MRVDTPITAPELDAAAVWLNVERPLSLRELRGSLVLLDFWTYCCINCMHVVPILREIERRHAAEPLVVIGVHSGKFDAEREPERIRAAIERHGVEHPVAVDDNMALWSRYAIHSWPTIVVVRPDGKIAAVAPGEPDLETLDALITDELEQARRAGTLAARRPKLKRTKAGQHEPLLFPSKVALTPDGQILIADGGHHRVLLCERDGTVVLTAGSGMRGFVDGELERAAFDDPQGLCMHEGAIYVADTRNHAIRCIDLDRREVRTVAGIGKLGAASPAGRAVAAEVSLRSPWDLASVGDAIYVAMAGSHQIWRYFPKSGEIEVYAGTGVEALLDGEVATSAWAQPSGLAEKDGVLYVADSESSALRTIDLKKNLVATLVGQGLFAFGDDDGSAEEAMLQHCVGVAVHGDDVLIADTYNNKIKRWSARDGAPQIRTVLDGLSEPSSVVVADDGVLFVADTNAHRILGVREGAIAELRVKGAPSPQHGSIDSVRRSERPTSSSGGGWFTNLLELPAGMGLKPGDAGVSLILGTPPGTLLAPDSPIEVRVEVSRRADLLLAPRPAFTLHAHGGKTQLVAIEVRVKPLYEPVVEAEIVATIDYVACSEDDIASRRPSRVHVRVPLRLLDEGGERQLELGVKLASIDATREQG